MIDLMPDRFFHRLKYHLMVTFRWITLLCICLLVFSHNRVLAERAVPDSTLYLPFLVVKDLDPFKIIEKWEFNGIGSGFFFHTSSAAYFVTAKHILYNIETGQLLFPAIGLIGYGGDPNDTLPFVFDIDLTLMNRSKKIRAHDKYDVAIFRIGTTMATDKEGEQKTDKEGQMKYDSGVFRLGGLNAEKSKHIVAGMKSIKKYEEVLVSDDVLVFGYPTSIGLKKHPQIDYSQPLLRKGIVAGKNDNLKTIVIDCPIYKGNSGSPVIEIEYAEGSRRFRTIGLVVEFVPVVESWVNIMYGYENINVTNSGYAIVVPMDPILDLINDMEKEPGVNK